MDQIQEEVTNLKELMNKIKQIYNKHSNITDQQIDDILKHDLWWNADTCIKHGLVDQIISNHKLFQFEDQFSEF